MDSIDVLNFTALRKRTFEDNGPTNKTILDHFFKRFLIIDKCLMFNKTDL